MIYQKKKSFPCPFPQKIDIDTKGGVNNHKTVAVVWSKVKWVFLSQFRCKEQNFQVSSKSPLLFLSCAAGNAEMHQPLMVPSSLQIYIPKFFFTLIRHFSLKLAGEGKEQRRDLGHRGKWLIELG